MLSKRPPYSLIAVLCILCTASTPPVLTNSDIPQHPLTPHQVRLMKERPLPKMTAQSVLLVNLSTGQILYSQKAHERRAPASLAKMVTALVALERGELGQPMRVAFRDVRWVYSAAGLQNGEPVTLRQLLYLLLVPSDNAAANTIARELAGDVPTFVGWMNERVARWGLQDTHFTNPHGLDDDGSYSTAYDMAIIARECMSNAAFADIVNTEEAWVAGRTVNSTNELLGEYPGMLGVKTGTTDLAGECLVALVDLPGGRVLTVMMGSEDRFRETRRLLDYYYASYAELRIDLPQTLQNRYLDEDNQWHSLALEAPTTVLIRPWELGSDTYYRYLDDLMANPAPGQEIGALAVQLAGRPLLEIPLHAR